MQMNLNTDLSEKVAYDTSSLPVYIRRAYLSDYPNYSAVSHWHDDVEFILVLSGHMLYNVNGEISLIKEGEGIFVNTRQLHYGFSDDYSECHFICLILHPVTLCASNLIAQKYIHPVLDNKSQPYLVLHPDSANAKIILESIKDLYSCKTSETPELLTQSLLYRLWSSLFLLAGSQPPNPLPGNDRLIALKNMISYIETHHREKITLSQISAAGNAGKTTCCTIFQKYVNQTPMSYLTNYRLQKSVELLHQTDMTVTEIAYESGFSGASYFTETFKKVYGCTPTGYRADIDRRCCHAQQD